ncbi:RNA polymerase sigma-70 factor, ECF subfamily [Leucobacter sp. 7(1)]|uniref:sigma factor n=1 Tax=Leucobacter sp. 7(1) TaxID=1255613 RepID=UPI00097E9C3E|nr:sigma factor [Leucobacter sp. 7(1)]SJN08351.1 RNA polymerase sigma-70 factor, ECF subfamily [Leucobacter sp. 7(1)]
MTEEPERERTERTEPGAPAKPAEPAEPAAPQQTKSQAAAHPNELVAAEIADRGSTAARRLFGVAYRMLGSVHDAEDALQDTLERWLSLTRAERAKIAVPHAWLRTVLTRRCLDVLAAAPRKREQYRGVWIPEPLLPGDPGTPDARDPAERVVLNETVTLAVLFAMEALTPIERVSFVLHEAFGVPFPEIATAVRRSAASCRQAATSARSRLRAARELSPDPHAHSAAVAAFAAACATGDLDALIRVLDPSVVVRSDGGGLVQAALKPVFGAERVAGYLLGIIRIQSGKRMALSFSVEAVNGRDGVVVREAGEVVTVVDFGRGPEGIREISLQVNPEKLSRDGLTRGGALARA